MRRYIDEPSISIGSEFGDIDLVRVLGEIVKSTTPQYWGAGRGGSILTNLEIRDGVLYFGACDGNFYALDADTGNEKWRFSAGDVILSFVMGSDAIFASCYDRNIYAIGFDGRERWRFRTNGRPGNMEHYEGRIYFGTEEGSFYCLDESGRRVWVFGTNSMIGAKPELHGGMVMFGDFHGTFYSLDSKTGRVVWKFKAAAGLGGGRFYEGMIYLPCISNVLYALMPDGRLVWEKKFGVGLAVDTLYAPCRGMVFAAGRGGGFFALSAKTSEIVWKFSTDSLPNVFSAESNGVIYFSDCNNNFYAIKADSGKLVWSFKTEGPNPAGIVVDDERVYFGSWDCNVYCLKKDSGSLLWRFRTSIATMSSWLTDKRMDREEEGFVVSISENDMKEIRKEDEQLKDYGEFSGSYMSKDGMSYISSQKKGYVKKRDF
jgi:outer membrane protein assembly factor BamB